MAQKRELRLRAKIARRHELNPFFLATPCYKWLAIHMRRALPGPATPLRLAHSIRICHLRPLLLIGIAWRPVLVASIALLRREPLGHVRQP